MSRLSRATSSPCQPKRKRLVRQALDRDSIGAVAVRYSGWPYCGVWPHRQSQETEVGFRPPHHGGFITIPDQFAGIKDRHPDWWRNADALREAMAAWGITEGVDDTGLFTGCEEEP